MTVLVDEDMAEIARRVRAKAKARGMTDEVFEALTKDDDLLALHPFEEIPILRMREFSERRLLANRKKRVG